MFTSDTRSSDERATHTRPFAFVYTRRTFSFRSSLQQPTQGTEHPGLASERKRSIDMVPMARDTVQAVTFFPSFLELPFGSRDGAALRAHCVRVGPRARAGGCVDGLACGCGAHEMRVRFLQPL